MQTAPVQEIYSTRAQIPAGDYELIADVRELPALAKLLAASGGAIPFEAATLVSSQGNLSQLMEYIHLFSINKLIELEQKSIKYHEAIVKFERENFAAMSKESQRQVESAKNALSRDEEKLAKAKQQLACLLAERAKQLKATPAISVKPAYLSLLFNQPLAGQIIERLKVKPYPYLKKITVNGTFGYELDVSALPDVFQNFCQEKLQGTPTLFFHLVDADKLVVALGTGTEALDKLKSGGATMAASSITVPRAVKAHLWLDASLAQSVSSLDFHAMKNALLASLGEDEHVVGYCGERFIASLQRLMPRFTEGIGMQLWTQDGDIYGKLHTAMSNYQLATATPLGAQLASRPDIVVYGELSPLCEEQTAALTEIPLMAIFATLSAFERMPTKNDPDAATPSQSEKLRRHKNATQSVLKLLPSMAGNVGLFAKQYDNPEDKNSRYARVSMGTFAGIKDKTQLAVDSHAAVDAVTRALFRKEQERKIAVEALLQLADNTAESGFYFRAGNRLLAFGEEREMVEGLVAAENTPAVPAMSGARFLWRGKLLQQLLAPSLREKVEGFYLRLDSAGEKKDVYFKLDMK